MTTLFPQLLRSAKLSTLEKLPPSAIRQGQKVALPVSRDSWQRATATTPASNPSKTNPFVPVQASLVRALELPYHFEVVKHSASTGMDSAQQLSPSFALRSLQKAKSVAIGDLHASTRKLMETLVSANFVRLPVEEFHRLKGALSVMEDAADVLDQKMAHRLRVNKENAVDIKPELQILKRSHEEILSLLPKLEWVGGKRQFILIGDVLADRGPLDHTTLAIIEHLDKLAPNGLVRLAANHDHNALSYITDDDCGFQFQAQSLHNADKLARQTYGGVDALKSRYLNYLLQSKIFHWDAESKTLYSHAPITRDCLETSVDRLVSAGAMIPHYEMLTPSGMPLFVDSINKAYREHVLEMVETVPEHRQWQLDAKERAFHKLVWCRSPLSKAKDLPFTEAEHGVKVFAHGHDADSAGSPFAMQNPKRVSNAPLRLVNLDNMIRKNGVIQGSSPLLAIEN